MNPPPPPPPPPPQQPTSQPSSVTCNLHPDETFSTFCPLCLCERLTTLDQSTTAAATSSHRHSTSAAIKSLFTNTNSLLLRRTKSFSAAKNDHTLSSLFVNDQHIQQHVTDVNVNDESIHIADQTTEIEEIEEELDAIDESLKKMKEHIDGTQFKKHSKSKIWSVSVLTKKWQNWRKKNNNKANEHEVLPVVDNSIASQYRETQSEIADYGYGRRSCDVDPRFSLDVGRVSFDDPRYSFDEPRASWDGYMIGRSFPRLPPMVEDVAPVVVVPQGVGLGTRAPVVDEENDDDIKDDLVPGGLGQTKEYYTDSSSKRRMSLDRSNSIRKMAAEMDETKLATSVVSNAKVSPASVECNYGRNGGLRVPSIGCEQELARDSNANSLRDDCSETFELRFRDGEKKEGKKTRRWKWKLWGLIQRRGNKDDDEDDRFSRLNGVARSYSGSWEQSGTNQKVFRSNSSVSWRNSSVDMKKSNSEMNRLANGKNRRVGGDEFVLERNRSARHSPNHADSGLLRFYLTPLRGSRRSKPTSNSNNSIVRNTLRL